MAASSLPLVAAGIANVVSHISRGRVSDQFGASLAITDIEDAIRRVDSLVAHSSGANKEELRTAISHLGRAKRLIEEAGR